MDQRKILDVVLPHQLSLITPIVDAVEDITAIIPSDILPTIGATARANFIHDRVMHRLEVRYGQEGNPSVQSKGLLRYLLFKGPRFCVGATIKKLDRNYRSSNVMTDQQTAMRESQCLLWPETKTAHIILGYRTIEGESSVVLSEICFSQENCDGVLWVYPVWRREGEGAEPITVQPGLPLMPKTAVRAKRKIGGGQGVARGGA